MNDLLQKLGGSKKVLIIGGIALIVLILTSGILGQRQKFSSMSGKMVNVSAPEVAYDRAGMPSYAGEETVAVSAPSEMNMQRGRGSMPTPIPNPSAPSGEAKIVKSADLSLYVKDVTNASQAIDAIRMTLGGQTGGAYFTEYQPGVRTGSVTIWVPSARFDDALLQLKALAIRVNEERITASDVSAQFVDLTARVKNLRATEAQLVEIMKRSGSVADILNVSRELSNTRGEIEQLEGALNHLNTQVAYSSIHLSLIQEANPSVVTSEWNPLAVLKNALKGTLVDLTHIANMVIVFVVRLPILLLSLGFWALLFFGLWKFARFLYGKLYTTAS